MRRFRLSPHQTLWMLLKPFLSLMLALAACRLHPLWLLPTLPLHLLTTVCTLHDAVHGNLGLRRSRLDAALFAYGALMLQSGHSFRRTHLYHHQHFPCPSDLEGHPAAGTWLQSLAVGPTYLGRLWLWTWRRYPRDRRWLALEACHQAAWLAAAAACVLPGWLWVMPWALVVAAWGLPLVTATLQHDPRGDTPEAQTRTVRHPLVGWLLQGLGYHREHHRRPFIPALRLRESIDLES